MVQFTGSAGNLASLYQIADKKNVWLLELQNGAENRLTVELMTRAINPALDIVEQEHFRLRNAPRESTPEGSEYKGGALIISGLRSQNKFFCNGFNFDELVNVSGLLPEIFTPLAIRLLTFPGWSIQFVSVLSISYPLQILSPHDRRNKRTRLCRRIFAGHVLRL